MKSVVVTGVCGGVGQALAILLREQGWAVCGIDVHSPPENLGLYEFWKGNVADDLFWRDQLVPAFCRSQSLRALVHSAAVQPCKSIENLTLAEWNETLAVNLTASFLGTQHLAPLMRDFGGAIVNVASIHAIATSSGIAAYAASKGGLVAFTRAAALELAKHNIRVNAVLPGAIETQMLQHGFERDSAGCISARATLLERTPLRRVAAPREIAKAISFLIDSEQSAFMTGQTLVVDGGALARLSTE